jgi:hypothetical protein
LAAFKKRTVGINASGGLTEFIARRPTGYFLSREFFLFQNCVYRCLGQFKRVRKTRIFFNFSSEHDGSDYPVAPLPLFALARCQHKHRFSGTDSKKRVLLTSV